MRWVPPVSYDGIGILKRVNMSKFRIEINKKH